MRQRVTQHRAAIERVDPLPRLDLGELADQPEALGR
jgi:hypothetical protein